VRSAPEIQGPQQAGRRSRVLSQNLLALGFTSFFTDISSEMVVAVLPLFFVAELGVGFFGLAAFEAVNQTISAVARIWGGSVSDNRQSHKKTAATGYSISAVTRLGLIVSAFVTGPALAVPFLLGDRVGKGLRTAPRDALISLSTAPNRLAMAFGIHRAMDTAGALLGPVVAFLIWQRAEGAFDAIFVISALVALVGVAVIWLFAEEKPQRNVDRVARPGATKQMTQIIEQWREVTAIKSVRTIAAGVAMLTLVTIGDAFIYLTIQRTSDMSARYFPLLFAGTAVVYLILATPFGRIADRVGTRPVFLFGNAVMVALYLILGFSGLGVTAAILCLGLLGAYYAATDGVVPAMVSQIVPSHIRASGIAFISVVIAASRGLSALLFATLFASVGKTTTMVVLAIAMTLSVLVGMRLLSTRQADAHD